MSDFQPFPGKVEIEPIHEEEVILSDGKRYEQMGKVIRLPIHFPMGDKHQWPKVGDIVFFLSHGVEQTPKYNGVEHYVVPFTDEFIIGVIPCDEPSQAAQVDTSTPTESKLNFQMVSANGVGGVSEQSSSTTEPPTTSI